jgi:hypothetical protein
MSDTTVPAAASRLVPELEAIFRTRLRMVAVYGEGVHLGDAGSGSHAGDVHTLVVADSLEVTDLQACAALAGTWAARRLAVPLLMTTGDLARSLDAFPMEFSDIAGRHHTIFGEDLLATLRVRPEDLRRACEAQTRGHALHLREAYVESGAHPRDLARLLKASAPAFRGLLQRLATLGGHAAEAGDRALIDVARAAGADESTVRQLLALATSGSISPGDADALYHSAIAAADALVRHVDAWRA